MYRNRFVMVILGLGLMACGRKIKQQECDKWSGHLVDLAHSEVDSAIASSCKNKDAQLATRWKLADKKSALESVAEEACRLSIGSSYSESVDTCLSTAKDVEAYRACGIEPLAKAANEVEKLVAESESECRKQNAQGGRGCEKWLGHMFEIFEAGLLSEVQKSCHTEAARSIMTANVKQELQPVRANLKPACSQPQIANANPTDIACVEAANSLNELQTCALSQMIGAVGIGDRIAMACSKADAELGGMASVPSASNGAPATKSSK
jgi:hypothetical protein